MTIERIFDIQGFSGGESDDLYKGPTNSFYQGENIEVRKDQSGVKLASNLENYLAINTNVVIDSTITYMITTDELGVPGNLIICLANGKIYYGNNLVTTINTGTSAWNQVIGIGANTVSGITYFYLISKTDSGVGKIHRTNTSLTDWTGINYKTYNVALGTPTKAPTVTSGPYLYIGVQNKVLKLYGVGEILTDGLVLPTTEEIVGLSQFQDSYRIYANKGNGGKQYKWDGNAITPFYSQEWINLGIQAVCNDGGYDKAILGFNEDYSDFYNIQDTQKGKPLRANLEASTTSRVFNKHISIRKGIVYISGGKTGESSNYGIYTYGNYYPGTPMSLVQQYSKTTNKFTFHAHGITQSYFADENGGVWYINHENPAKYASSGYIVSNMYQGNAWEDLKLKKIKVAFQLETGSSAKIYVRTNRTGDWIEVKSIDNTNYGNKKRLCVTSSEWVNNSIEIGNFNEIEAKIELTAGTSQNYTPIIKRVTLFMEVINED